MLSDIAIGLAYLSIPAVLVLLVQRRSDLAYPWIAGMFALFILACGATHLVHAYALFRPVPELEGIVKAATAAISVAVAFALWPVLPKLLALRSPAALAREVEERRAAEGRALASEARTATFIANLPEALFVVRVEPSGALVIETVNPAFERLFGVGIEQVAGRPAEAATSAALVQLCLPRWHEAAASGETIDYELTAEMPAGRLTWQTVLVPMRGPDGRVERLLGSARDVTATRRLQAGLVQSARLATVGTMCAGLAHEASQPLNIAGLWLRRLRSASQALAAEQQAALQRAATVVEEQLRRTGDLVARIRALAGDEGGAVEQLDAAGPVAAAVRIATSQYAAEDIAVSMRGAAEALPVRASAVRLERAVLELLANARDAVLERRRDEPGAPARIELCLWREGNAVMIEVRDTGHGIAERARDSLFDPFFTTKEPGRGIGLGLAFAAGVARGMGGAIEASNLLEGGACFRMRLVAAEPAVAGALRPGYAAA